MEEKDSNLRSQMINLIKDSKMNIKTIASKLKINENEILNIYLLGSRLWGTAGPQSDWDFLIVLKSLPSGKATTHNAEIDATLYSKEKFLENSKENSFLELLCRFLPQEYVWRESVDLKKEICVIPKLLIKSVKEEADRDWNFAKKQIEKQNIEKGKKILIHLLRMLQITIQILQNTSSSIDFYVGLQYKEILDFHFEKSWESYQALFQVEYSSLLDTLDAFSS